jgi:hypothetical protein
MSGLETVVIRAAGTDDRAWIERHLSRSWGSAIIVTRGTAYDALQLPALLAIQGDDIVGLATFRVAGGECELVSLDSLRPGHGIGSALLKGVANEGTGADAVGSG